MLNSEKLICTISISKRNNGVSIDLYELNGQPYAAATIPLEGLEKDEVVIKNYSENKGIYEALVQNAVIHEAHKKIQVGLVSGVPVCRMVDVNFLYKT